MKNFCFLLIFIFSFLSTAFPQWSWQGNLPQGNDLYSVSYIDSNTCTAVGDGGTIIRTDDGGNTWVRQHSGTIARFYSVAFANVNTGIVVGDSGIVLTTTNGGLVWTRQNSQASVSLRAAAFQDPITITVVGSSGLIIKSSDGGNIWVIKNSGTSKGLMCVSFLNKSEGVIGGYSGTLLKTTDGGETWNILPPPADIYEYYTITFRDTNRIYTGSAMSSDGGITWVKYDNPGFFGLSFANKSRAVGVSVNGQIFRTTDSGLTWSCYVPDPSVYLQGVSFSDSLHGMIIGLYGTIFKTSDGGITWQQISKSLTTERLSSVSFANKTWGYAAGGDHNPVQTSDGGNHWEKISAKFEGDFSGVFLLNEKRIVIISINGEIILSNDGGKSWSSNISYMSLLMNSLTFSDANNGIIVGDTILKTTNGGETWVGRNRGVWNTLYGAHFPDSQTGYAVGSYGTIIKTTDGGDTWVTLAVNSDNNSYYGVAFTDAENGTIVGSYGTILHTTNGGTTWSKQPAIVPSTLWAIAFSDKKNGTIVGLKGTIMHTSDNGENWTLLEPVTGHALRGICFSDNNNGYVVGDYGTILHTTNGGVSFINDNFPAATPYNFKLAQNYPNPFNPETVIEYQIPVTGFVTLRIYDILGREVKTLVNGIQTTGKHTCIFDGSQFESGVYLYQLKTGAFSETRKMLFLK